MTNQIHMPTGGEALEYCQKKLPRFKWQIFRDAVEQVYLLGVFKGKILYLKISLDIQSNGAMAWIVMGNRPNVRCDLAQSAEKKGISYQMALAEVTDKLIDLVRDAHDLGLDSVIEAVGPLA